MSGREILDSPTEWVADHIHRYVKSGGKDGHIWKGVPTLLLTTVGRKTGLGRRTALIYGTDGEDYIIVASKGGHPSNPLWYENLVNNPEVEIQVGAEVASARASTITDQLSYDRNWIMMVGMWPGFDEYKAKTSRVIPLVAIRPH
jgi:deazaflavin-dependent oxidoreductase (nitroreductase family)